MRLSPAVLTLFAVGLVLRPQIVGVGPLLPKIESSLEISHGVAGLLTTIPVFCMGVFAPLAPPLLRRYGSRIAIGASLLGVAAFGVLRAVAPGAPLLLLLTVPVGMGIAAARHPHARRRERGAPGAAGPRHRRLHDRHQRRRDHGGGGRRSARDRDRMARRRSSFTRCSRSPPSCRGSPGVTARRRRPSARRSRSAPGSPGSSSRRSRCSRSSTTASSRGSRTSTPSGAGATPRRARSWRC